MNLKKYSDFHNSIKEEKTEEKTEEKQDEKTVKESIKSVKEEVLLNPDVSNIEILEEKIIKFNTGSIKDIMETIKTKYSDTDYFIRKKDNELHIVKYNEKLNLNMNEFVNSLLKYYSSKDELRKIIEGIKVKGNTSFSIIENMKSQYSNKFVNDLTNLLSKKNKQ